MYELNKIDKNKINRWDGYIYSQKKFMIYNFFINIDLY